MAKRRKSSKRTKGIRAAQRVSKCLRRKHGSRKKYTLKQKANCGSKSAKKALGRR